MPLRKIVSRVLTRAGRLGSAVEVGGDGVDDDDDDGGGGGAGEGKRVLVRAKRAGYAVERIATESRSGVSDGR